VNFISAYSVIRNKGISQNGKLLFAGNADNSLDQFLVAAYEFINPEYPKFYKMDHLSKLGFLACEVLLKARRLKEEQGADKVAIVLTNASSSLDTDRNYFKSTKQIASPALFVYTLPNIVAGELCIRHGWKGENGFFVFEKFNPGFITGYVDQVIARGAESCIAGWIETSGEAHDVFLYLTEKEKRGEALDHTSEAVSKFYNQ